MVHKLITKRETEAEIAQRRSRRRKVCAIVGAVIAFLAFLLKEPIREPVKGVSDAISAAQREVSAANAAEGLSDQQVELSLQLQTQIKGLKDLLSKAGTTHDPSAYDVTTACANLSQAYSNAQTRVNRVSDLLDTLPMWLDKFPQGTKELRAARDKAKSELNDLGTKVQATIKENRVPKPDVKNYVVVMMEMVGVVVTELVGAMTWESQVEAAAAHVKKRADGLYILCTWLSYLFIVLGSLITIVSLIWFAEG